MSSDGDFAAVAENSTYPSFAELAARLMADTAVP